MIRVSAYLLTAAPWMQVVILLAQIRINSMSIVHMKSFDLIGSKNPCPEFSVYMDASTTDIEQVMLLFFKVIMLFRPPHELWWQKTCTGKWCLFPWESIQIVPWDFTVGVCNMHGIWYSLHFFIKWNRVKASYVIFDWHVFSLDNIL